MRTQNKYFYMKNIFKLLTVKSLILMSLSTSAMASEITDIFNLVHGTNPVCRLSIEKFRHHCTGNYCGFANEPSSDDRKIVLYVHGELADEKQDSMWSDDVTGDEQFEVCVINGNCGNPELQAAMAELYSKAQEFGCFAPTPRL